MLEQLLSSAKKPNNMATFLGEVTEEEFISATALTSLVGMAPYGTVTNANIAWLKYLYKGKTVYLAKKVIKHAMTWEQLNTLGLTKGTQQFTIQGKAHTLRLPTGWISPPVTNYDVSTGGSFNDLIYPIYNGVSKDHQYVQAYPKQAAYTDADLGLITNYLESSSVPGACTWVQDLRADNAGHMVRGYNDADKAHQLTAGWFIANGATQSYAGWRPIVEEV